MSRTNKSRMSGSRRFHRFMTWTKRSGNKVSRASAHQRAKTLRRSVFETLLVDIAADQLEERGALAQAMKLRNANEPVFPGQPHDVW